MIRSRQPAALVLSLVLLVAVGCGGGGSAGSSGGGSSGGADHRGGTLVIAWNGIGSSIDTSIDYDQNWGILTLTNDGLTGYKHVGGAAGNTLVPDLAESLPTPTDGGRTYAFTLRPGIRYSTGQAVKASDFRYTIEREFRIHGPVPNFYQGIVGGDACLAKASSCDLSKGIVTDDAARTITFHLTRPDPDFLHKLSVPFAYVVPSGTPNQEVSTTPLPATGPYMIDHYSPNSELLLVRNPHFTQWSKDAQPDGYPDRIDIKLRQTTESEVTMIEQGQADWMYDQPPADRLNELGTKYADQLHINPVPQVYHMALNTRVAPFDNVDVRRALNYATDRSAVVKIWGGSTLAKPTCQILPPDFPGYAPYCPYTTNAGDGKWHAPDMAKAKALVDASGTKGDKVATISTPDEVSKSINLYFVSLLRQLGYDASIKVLSAAAQYPYVQNSSNHAQMSFSYWYPDYPAASNFFDVVIGCHGFHPNSNASANLSEFCQPRIQKMTAQAMTTASTDPQAADSQWQAVDRATTDQAPWVPLFVPNRLDFLSKRVGNYQFSPAVTVSGPILDQLWVQ